MSDAFDEHTRLWADEIAPPPNPGSREALDLGCRCAVLDNNHGRSAPWPPDGWFITEGCPIHHIEQQPTEEVTNMSDTPAPKPLFGGRTGRPPGSRKPAAARNSEKVGLTVAPAVKQWLQRKAEANYTETGDMARRIIIEAMNKDLER